jgi:hypothetical protein
MRNYHERSYCSAFTGKTQSFSSNPVGRFDRRNTGHPGGFCQQMNHIVLPLSAIPFKVSHAPGNVATALLILMFCVGLPIALVVRRYSK